MERPLNIDFRWGRTCFTKVDFWGDRVAKLVRAFHKPESHRRRTSREMPLSRDYEPMSTVAKPAHPHHAYCQSRNNTFCDCQGFGVDHSYHISSMCKMAAAALQHHMVSWWDPTSSPANASGTHRLTRPPTVDYPRESLRGAKNVGKLVELVLQKKKKNLRANGRDRRKGPNSSACVSYIPSVCAQFFRNTSFRGLVQPSVVLITRLYSCMESRGSWQILCIQRHLCSKDLAWLENHNNKEEFMQVWHWGFR